MKLFLITCSIVLVGIATYFFVIKKDDSPKVIIQITFPKNLFLPKSYFKSNTNSDSLQDFYFKKNNINRLNVNVNVLKQLKIEIEKISNGKELLSPIFDISTITAFYKSAYSPVIRTPCTPLPITFIVPNLFRSFTICTSSSNCTLIEALIKLMKDNSGSPIAITVSCTPNQVANNSYPDIPITPSAPTLPHYQTQMGIDRWGLNGTKGNIIVIENSETLNNRHSEFKSTFNPSYADLGGRRDNNAHSSWTAGVLFSDPKTRSSDSIFKNYCKGVCPEATLKKVVVFGSFGSCSNSGANAIAIGIANASQGNILLIEFAKSTGPIEEDLTIRELIKFATEYKRIIVIEPMGNNNNPTYSNTGVQTSNAIFVSGVEKTMVYDPTTVFGINQTTCLAPSGSDFVLTTHKNGNDYRYFGGTSCASAVIAGMATCLQGYYFDRTGCYLTPQQMKCLFKNTKGINSKIMGVWVPNAMNLKAEVDKKIANPSYNFCSQR